MPLTGLAVTVLGLLVERPMHPYEMVQLASSRRGRLVKIRPGSLYHSVTRLEADGLVRARGTDRAGKRPERTVYEVTGKGREAFRTRVAELLGSPPQEYPQFPLAIAEAHNLDVETVARLLTERIAAREQEIARLDDTVEAAESGGVPELFSLGTRYLAMLARAEVDWLRAVVARIEGGDLPWLTSDEVVRQLERLARNAPSGTHPAGTN